MEIAIRLYQKIYHKQREEIAMSKFKLPSREMIADREDLIEASNAKSRLNRETIDFDKPKANRIFRVHDTIIPMDYAMVRDEGNDETLCLLNFEEDHEEAIKVFLRRKALGVCYICLCVDTQDVPFIWLAKQAGHGKKEKPYHVSVRDVITHGQNEWIVAYWDDTSKTYTVERGDLADGKQPIWPTEKSEKTVEEIITDAVETTGNFITSISDPRVVSFRTGVTGQ